MQRDALAKIELMHREIAPANRSPSLQVLAGLLLLAGWLVWQRPSFVAVRARLAPQPPGVSVRPAGGGRDLRGDRLSVLLQHRALALRTCRWRSFRIGRSSGCRITPRCSPIRCCGAWGVFIKTIVWTVVNVAFHVGLGVLLAVALNGPIRGKALYRILLIIPWAVPAYITALTWRGMFDYEYGAVNLLLTQRKFRRRWLLTVIRRR